MDLYLHPQCAWTPMVVAGRTSKECSGCGALLAIGTWQLVTRLGHEANRCTESTSPKVWQCVSCVKAFLDTHHSLLDGWIGEHSQFDTPVAWLPQSTLFGGPAPRLQPNDKVARARMRAVFRVGDASEKQAVERHKALQKVIAAALKEDARRGGKESAKKK